MSELVVFLPAVGGDATFWEPQVRALADEWHTLALDLERPADEVSLDAFAQDVRDAVVRQGFTRAHLVGLSMGGVVAQWTRHRFPRLVASLTLCNTWAFAPDGAGRVAWVSGELAQRSVAEFSRASLPGLFAPGTDRALVERCIAVESRKPKDAYLAMWRAMFGQDLRPLLHDVDVPTLLIGGALDPVTPTSLLAEVAARLPTARLVELPAASHFSNLDAPAQFTATLRAFLREAGGRGQDQALPPETSTCELPAGSVASQLLRLLTLRGIDTLFANSGTDFTPVIDALAELPELPLRVVAAPHENTAIAMAHGHALITGRPQAVMGHVTVGGANMGLGLINARRARVPMLVLAGRTPLYEEGLPGVRSNFVQWGQEARDQAGMFREYLKWDFELRGPQALDSLLERALAIARSEPQGPVYLSLPREPLCAPAPARSVPLVARQQPARPNVPDERALDTARLWLARARRPLIVTADLGRFPGGPEALVRLALRCGAGVIEHGKRNFFNFPTEHPHHLGFEPWPHVAEADLVLAVECPVPWVPALARGRRVSAPVVQIGVDPLHEDLPLRGFPCDLTLRGDPVETLRRLADGRTGTPEPRPDLAALHARLFGEARAAAAQVGETITKSHLSLQIGQAIDDDVVIWNEYPADPWLVPRRTPASWFENSSASGLGWSLGAALGGKLAAPERTMLVTVGDGAYLLNTPLSAHHVAQAERLPILVVVFDDAAWSTIKKSVKGAHPDGAAVRTGRFALCDFEARLDYARVAEAAGGIGRRVERPQELPGALREGLQDVRAGSRLVLLQVVCQRDG